MTYPTPEPPPTDPPLTDPPLTPQQPYVPGSNLPGYEPPTETYSSSPAPGVTPDVPGHGTPAGPAADPYGYGAPTAAAPGNYGYGAPGAHGYGTPTAPGPDAYGYGAPAGYGSPQPYYPMYPYGYAPARETEGLAIASLVVSCAAVLGVCTWGIGGLLGIVGAVLGHVARNRIKRTGRGGDGMALAGIIVGWVLTAICAALAVVVILVVTHGSSSTESI